jgi:hypothetical protein
MLYPLSYEGLACTFAQRAERVPVGWARAGYPVPDVLCCTCAACRGPASDPRREATPLIVRLVLILGLSVLACHPGALGETLRCGVLEVVVPFCCLTTAV